MKASFFNTLGLVHLLTFTLFLAPKISSSQNQNSSRSLNNEDVTMTIDNKTSSENFKEIHDMLLEYGVTSTFSEVQRNDNGELTALKISLKTANGQQTSSQISSNRAIGKISFGLKQGRLFIDQGGSGLSMFAFNNATAPSPFQFLGDSLAADHLQQLKFFSFSDFFDEDDGAFNFSKDSMAIDKFHSDFYPFFKDPNAESDVFSWMKDPYSASSSQKFQFIDDPSKNKVIIIDGQASDFKTLDELAKNNKIDKVDVLKPETAQSIYGASARDGAIIVTTKQ